MSTPLNPFNVTPELTQAAFSQKPDKESFTPPPPLNPAFLTPPPTVQTLSQQGPKLKRRRIQFVNYLDDLKAHGKQLRKRQHKKFKPYKYSMGEEDIRINLSFALQIAVYLIRFDIVFNTVFKTVSRV